MTDRVQIKISVENGGEKTAEKPVRKLENVNLKIHFTADTLSCSDDFHFKAFSVFPLLIGTLMCIK